MTQKLSYLDGHLQTLERETREEIERLSDEMTRAAEHLDRRAAHLKDLDAFHADLTELLVARRVSPL